MVPIDWLRQLGIPFLRHSRAAAQCGHGHGARRCPSFRPHLESLEERLAPSASPLQLDEAVFQKGAALLHQSSNPCAQKGYDIPAAEIGLQVMFTGFATVNLSLARAGIQLAAQGLAAYISDSVKCGLQELDRLLFPVANASSSAPNPSIVGTYSGTLVPTDTFPTDPFGNVSPTTPQKVTLTINANGSGSMSISPFDGTPLTVSFPAGTAQFPGEQSVSIGNPDYNLPNGGFISVSASLLPSNSNALNGNFVGENALGDEADFLTVTLNRQG